MPITPELEVLQEVARAGFHLLQLVAEFFVIQLQSMLFLVGLSILLFGSIGVTGFWLFLPSYAANMTPVGASALFRRLGWWNGPIWERRLGTNKTWFGTTSGLLAAVLVAWAEAELEKRFPFLANLRPEAVRLVPWPLFGLLMGVGALVIGDMSESLLKRSIGIKPGESWKHFDDIDHGLGHLVLG